MKRPGIALAVAAVLISLLPATASAAKATKYDERLVYGVCDQAFPGGFVEVVIFTSQVDPDSAQVTAWSDPAIPFEDPPSASGFADTLSLSEPAGQEIVSGSMPLFDGGGAPVEGGSFQLTLAPSGPPNPITPSPFKDNRNDLSTGYDQPLAGSGTVSLPDGVVDLEECFGDLFVAHVHVSNPHASVSSDSGVRMSCFWPIGDDGFAFVEIRNQSFGFDAFAELLTPDVELDAIGVASGSIDATHASADIAMVNAATGEASTASATATFTKLGGPFRSNLITQYLTGTLTEQALASHGTLVFSAGPTFTIDPEHCSAQTFSEKDHVNQPSGPKPSAAPSNDTPAGAIALKPGKTGSSTVKTGGTAVDAEILVETCPDGFRDQLGHTVWYTVAGTGGPITIDTAGSNFDTVVGVFTRDGDAFTEVGCNDDVLYEPVGISLQAALTIDTEVGTTYWLEVGGYFNLFTGTTDWGTLKVSVK